MPSVDQADGRMCIEVYFAFDVALFFYIPRLHFIDLCVERHYATF